MTERGFDPKGKAALFSAPGPSGPVEISCSGCGATSSLGILGLVKAALPVWFADPLRYHHVWMRCPACGERRWLRIRLSR